jgi:predicted MPP superfamily phosphohydrolase
VHTAEVGRLVRELAALRPRDGVAVIGGNHDYYAGLEAVLEAASRGGARVLRNEGIVVAEASVALLGLDDVWGARYGWGPGPDLSVALAGVPADLPRVVLSHNPVTFTETAGRVALQLSGHTHGGQLAIAGYPAGVFLPYVRGLYRERGSQLYVNRGFGVAGPAARLGAPPELTVITLRT